MRTLIGMIFACMFMMLGGITLSASASDEASELSYIIEDGSKYYESSFAFGSGRTAIVTEDNPYTSRPCYAGINGYSFLDKYGNVIMCDYNEATNNITIPEQPKTAVRLFVHFRTENYRNGWTNSENVINLNNIELTKNEDDELPEEQEAEEIIENIGKEIQESKDKQTTIVVDFSGSMLDNQKEVVDLLGTLNELDSDNTKIIVFADTYEVITKQRLIDEDFNVGGGTYMLQALNEAINIGTEKMIIISDLETYDLYKDITLKQSKVLESVIIYDPDDSFGDDIVDKVFKVTWNDADICRIKIKD